MKKALNIILLFAVSSVLLTKPISINKYELNNVKNLEKYSVTQGNSLYNEKLTAKSQYSPGGWHNSLFNHVSYTIPTYYNVEKVDIKFGTYISGGFGWQMYETSFSKDMLDYLNTEISGKRNFFHFYYWSYKKISWLQADWIFDLKIHNETNKHTFYPSWSRWNAQRQTSGMLIELTFHVKNTLQEEIDNVEQLMKTKVNNKTITLKSDVGSSINQAENIIAQKGKLDKLIKEALGKYYHNWKNSIKGYTYKNNKAEITIKFYNSSKKKHEFWTFSTNINVELTKKYWEKKILPRLKIIPGKVINNNGEMVDDIPFNWNGKEVYGTKVVVVFDGNPDRTEILKVNGQETNVINNSFTFDLTDADSLESNSTTNEYNIVVEKHNLSNWSQKTCDVQKEILIKQNTPELNLKWHGWDPSGQGKQDQKILITPTLDNGKPNPHYDKEVNPKTGTKSQILWVKNKATSPFPLDPIDKNGDVITDGNYEAGFIAEGSVSGMGINQIHNDDWIKSITREEVQSDLKSQNQSTEIMQEDAKNPFSAAGTYHYVITDQKYSKAHKFIIIGQDYSNKYLKFLDVLDNPAVAVDFWTTVQGNHLKNYLIKYKSFDSKKITDLKFEQVMSYWKEYVSSVHSQRIGPEPNVEYLDLGKINFWTIKMNLSDIDSIREEIIKQIKLQMKKININLVYDLDYELKSIKDDNKLAGLLQKVHSNGNASIELKVNSLATSTKAIGSNTVKIINNKNYDPEKVIDLSQFNFDNHEYNFSKFKAETLKEWILKIEPTNNKHLWKQLEYGNDYFIRPLNTNKLNEFISNKGRISLELIVESNDNSIKTKNGTTLILINNNNAHPAPVSPPTDINVNNLMNNNYSTTSTTWVISVIFGLIIISTILGYLIYHGKKKGIGGKSKITKQKIKKQVKKD